VEFLNEIIRANIWHGYPDHIEEINLKVSVRLLVVFGLGVFVSGCATTNFANSATPVTVKEQWIREGALTWGGPRVFSIGNVQLGFHQDGNENTYTVDPGEKALKVWYFGNRGECCNMFWLSDVVAMTSILKPNGRYELVTDHANVNTEEETLSFRLVDLDTKEVAAKSEQVPMKRGRSPIPPAPTVIPIYIPGR
jgi:hypothetical protein